MIIDFTPIQVLQGDAEKLRFGQSRTKVIVKVLKDDATPGEQLQFLEEVRVFRLERNLLSSCH